MTAAGRLGRRHPRPPQGALRAGQLRPQRGHLRRRPRAPSSPTRAVPCARSARYIGANSGPLHAAQHIFYARREDITTFLRVHAIPGVLDFFDYSPAASGMTYKSNADAARRDDRRRARHATPGQLAWETVDGTQGGLSIATLDPDRHPGARAAPPTTSTTAPRGRQRDAVHGRRLAYGSSGPWINQAHPEHRPAQHPVQQPDGNAHALLRVARQADGAKQAAQAANPLQVSVAPRD